MNKVKTLVAPIAAFAITAFANSAKAISVNFDVVSSTGLGTTGLEDSIARVINIALGFLGLISVIIILLGGFKWMTSGGDGEKIKGAKKLIGAGVVGLAIVLAAYAIAQFAVSKLLNVTGGDQ